MDDAHADPMQRNLPSARLGLRSSLRVPIKFDGRLVAALVLFLSFTPGFYTQKDVIDRAQNRRSSRARAVARQPAGGERARGCGRRARRSRLESRVKALTEELDARTGFRRVVGDSHAWRQVLTQATQVAPTDTTALLLGESGTGKEVAARFIHRASPRARRSVRGHQLRGAAGAAARGGAVRLRAGCLHGRDTDQAGAARAGLRRHAVPRRGRPR